jgi:hypothetical protein
MFTLGREVDLMIGDPKKDPKKHSHTHSPERDIGIFAANAISANEMTGAAPSADYLPIGTDGPLDLFPDLTTDPEDD